MGTHLASYFTDLSSSIGSLISAAALLISVLLLTRPTRETARRVKQMKKGLARNGSITFGSSRRIDQEERTIVTVRNPTKHVLYVKEVKLLAREKNRENFYINIVMNPEGDVEEGAVKIKVEPHQDQKWWTRPWTASDPEEKPEAILVLYYIEANNEIHQNAVEKLIHKYTPRDQNIVNRYWAEFQDGIERETSRIDWKRLSILDLSKVREMIHKRHMRKLTRRLRRLNVEKRQRLILGIPPKK
jgi:hypothetical protein